MYQRRRYQGRDKEEVESVDDSFTINQEIENSYVCRDIKEEIKEEESVDDPTESYIKLEIKEEAKEMDEGQGVEDSNLYADSLVDCSEYVQVQMNLTT